MWLLLLIATFASVVAFNTRHQRTALLIIVFLATGAFQLLPSWYFASPIALAKPYDYAYVATALILLTNVNRVGAVLATHRIAKIAVAYLAFLAAVFVLSVLVFGYKPVQALQMSRTFWWPAFLLLFLIVPAEKLHGFVKALWLIVVACSILYLIQPITGKVILRPESVYWNPYLGAGTDFKRYLSTPDFLIFFLLLSFAMLNIKEPKGSGSRLGYWLAFLLFSAVQIVSLTRSAIIATGIALLHLGTRFMSSVKAMLAIIIVLTGVVAVIVAAEPVRDKFSDGLEDVVSTLNGEFLNRYRNKFDGNFAFRIAHIHERASYILEDPRRWPIGIGFIHENSPEASRLGFKVGLPTLRGTVIQVDTGDIAWSIIIIKTGLLGTALLIWFLVASYRAVDPRAGRYSLVYRPALVYYAITSLFSASFATPNFMIPVMLFLALALYEGRGIATEPATERKPGKWQEARFASPSLRPHTSRGSTFARTSNPS